MEAPPTARTADIAPLAEPKVRNSIAVLVTSFPRIDQTFILREIIELERQGQPVTVVPLVVGNTKTIHNEAKPWVRRAMFLPLLSAEIVLSNAVMALRHPRKYLRILGKLIAGTFYRPGTLLRTLALFPKSVHLARVLPRRGVRHVHAHYATHATTMAYVIASLSNVTYSFTVHGPDIFVDRLMLREKLRGAKFVRSVSAFNKAFLCGLYPVATEGKIEVVHSGVNPDIYEQAAADAASAPRRRPRLLSVAALTPSRGFPFLIDACARLLNEGLDLECTIVGDGVLRDVTSAWVAKHGIGDNVRLTGALPQHEVARLMGAADVFVLPSIIAVDGQMDGIPMSLMEAMAAGKPVIASAVSGIPELVKHNVSGLLVDATHPERVASAVRRLLEEPALRASMGEAGREKIRRDFDIRNSVAKLVDLFDRHRSAPERTAPIRERIRKLNWTRLDAFAIGVRRIHERPASWMAEVTITDGIRNRDVIVRQQREVSEDLPSPLERARHEFEAMALMRDGLGEELGDETLAISYAVPRVLMFDEEHAALVIERADGISLDGILRGALRVRGESGAVRRAGVWLRKMQAATRHSEDGRHVLTAVTLLSLRALELASAGDRTVCRMQERIAQYLQEWESRMALETLPVVGRHGDYCPENIFIGNRRVDVIDFGGYREGLPLEDVADLLVHLELCCPWRSLRQIPKMRQAFLDGYGEAVDTEKLGFFIVAAALRLLAYGRGGDTTILDLHKRSLLRQIIARRVG